MAYSKRPVYPDARQARYEDKVNHFRWDPWYSLSGSALGRTRSAEPVYIERNTHRRTRGHSDTRYGEHLRPDAQVTMTRSAEPWAGDQDDCYEFCSPASLRTSRKSRPKKYWARPVDGTRRGTLGRLLDAWTGEGSDVFIVLTKSRSTLHRDIPDRGRRSGWEELSKDVIHHLGCAEGEPRLVREEPDHFERSGARQLGKYNSRTRRYESKARRYRDGTGIYLRNSVHWPDGVWAGDMDPEALLDGKFH